MKNENQCYRVITYMREHKDITAMEALSELGIFRLASRITDLKKRGYIIKDEWREVKNRYGETCRIKAYSLVGENNATKGKSD